MGRRAEVRKGVGKLGPVVVVVLLLGAAACAQLEVGEDVKLSLSGTLGVAYGGGFGSDGVSSHSLGFNGSGNLTGSYYNPNFLSFTVLPYYNRSQNNSQSQSIFDATGVTATVNLFSGSKYPGWVSYGKSINGSSAFTIPGLPGLEENGSSQSFAVGWSVLLPKLPTLSASFMSSSSSSTLLGTTGETDVSTKNLNLTSAYTLKGFLLNGFFTYQTMGITLPDPFGSTSSSGDSSSTGYGLWASHKLPLSGNFSASWSRTTFASEGTTGRSDGTTDTLTAGASFAPTRKLSVTADMRYIDNVLGVLQQSVLGQNGLPILPLDNGSHSVSFGTTASYALGHGFSLRGYADHLQQYYFGQNVSNTIYGGTINYNYARPLFGMLLFSFGMVNTANEQGNNGLGLVANVSMNRRFGKWDTSADFSYAQDVQTLLALYTTSSYTYGGYVRRRINWNTYWNGSARAAHSGLTQLAGQDNSSYTFSTGLTWRRLGVSGGYATSSGTTVLTANGLLTPTPEVGLITDNLVLYNARSYTAGVFLYPIKRMTIYGTYANAHSDTSSHSAFSVNQTELVNGRLEYRLRKLWVIGGFTRYRQGISASGAPPSVVNSYSIGISRWFNVF